MTSTISEEESFFRKYCPRNSKAITLDLLIGDPAYLGKGLAAKMIEQFLEEKYPEADVFIDPGVDNLRAIHVYEKVGFKVSVKFTHIPIRQRLELHCSPEQILKEDIWKAEKKNILYGRKDSMNGNRAQRAPRSGA